MMRPHIAVLSLDADGMLRGSWRIDHAAATRALGAMRFDGSLQRVSGSHVEDALVRREQEQHSRHGYAGVRHVPARRAQ